MTTHRRDGRPLNTAAWQRLRKRVLVRDHYRCRYCGKPANTADHVVPPGAGGAELDEANLVAACQACNLRKGPRPAASLRKAEHGRSVYSRPTDRPASPGWPITGDYTRRKETR
jgi:5-methylcytosine-specific restriction endonuclease McrA